jgi:hypothetical protein
MTRFFLATGGVAVLVGRVELGISGGVSSAGDKGPVMDRCELAAYPDVVEATVSERPSTGSSATCAGGPLGFSNEFAASWRSCFSFLRSSFDCSPGHSAGTFISHLLWHV